MNHVLRSREGWNVVIGARRAQTEGVKSIMKHAANQTQFEFSIATVRQVKAAVSSLMGFLHTVTRCDGVISHNSLICI